MRQADHARLRLAQPLIPDKLIFQMLPGVSPWFIRPVILTFTSQVDGEWLKRDARLFFHLLLSSLTLFEHCE